MSDTFRRIVDLVHHGEVRVSAHGYDEMAEDDILAGEVIDGVGRGDAIHVVWGIPRGQTSPAVLITAYRPDPARWTEDFLRRRQ